MEYRKLGTSDLEVSAIGLGTNNFGNDARIPDPAQSARVVHACLDAGINFIDTSNNYSAGKSESHIGEALKGLGRTVTYVSDEYTTPVLRKYANGSDVIDFPIDGIEPSKEHAKGILERVKIVIKLLIDMFT